ncbi:histidine phosphatase family protein [Tessaracoccus sp. OS52]|uniref:SixA phosphatase family protein n=1 Tax=Tessaracoccus sp. OS52 TaxID=2886691 RepID=UPI001D0FB497|nr:histidine phosphatase family protein [Tessaracoccus sp. OS52]MCC2594416.1 histidine phosphatase family protein [Tessaracoccus sp. OS52]
MRRLVLMRHAKTESNNPGGDHARELLPRGVQAAQEAGQVLRTLGLQYALVSTATRTRQTFAALGLDIPVEFQAALYHDGAETMLQRISETDDEITGLLVVGHAPTIPALSAQLGYASSPREADQLQCHFPTSAFAEFTFEGSWADLEPDNLEHVRLEQVSR